MTFLMTYSPMTRLKKVTTCCRTLNCWEKLWSKGSVIMIMTMTITFRATCSAPQDVLTAPSATRGQSTRSFQLCVSPAQQTSKKPIISKRTPTINSKPRMPPFILWRVISQIRLLRQVISVVVVVIKWTTVGIRPPQGLVAATNLCWTTLRIPMTGLT